MIDDNKINYDYQNISEKNLRRLLKFALKNDPSGERLKKFPPKNKEEVIIQLIWLGGITEII